MKLYISDLSLIALAIFYLPFVFWMLWKVVSNAKFTGLKKAFAVLVVLILAYVIPLGDVTLNSIAMAKVCPKAGMHIYKTVKVEGYYHDLASEDFFRRYPGFHFFEYKRLGEFVRLEKQNGKIVMMTLPAPTAEYEVLLGQWEVDKVKRIRVLRDVVRNRVSGDVLAERLMFNPLPGWVDRWVMVRWFGRFLMGCHGSSPGDALQDGVLLSNDSK